MKTFSILTAVILGISISCNAKSDSGFPFNLQQKEGKGPVTEKVYKMNFDEIKVAQSIVAEVIKSNEEKVVISAPSDLMEYILVENSGGKLYIHVKKGVSISTNNIRAKIYAKDFTKLEASSSANIKVKDKFTQDKTDIEVSSSGTISGNLEANEMSIDVSSSGTFTGEIWAVKLEADVTSSGIIKIAGKTKTADLEASSSGTLDARNVIAETAQVDASSSGSVSLAVSKQVNAYASSSGSISIAKKGNLNVLSKKESSGGSISIN